MLENIPRELQELNQWVCAGTNKLPLNPRTGESASVTDPATWGTFSEAVRAGYTHIGFVLTDSDPYTIIDLDEPLGEDQINRHAKIVQGFNSYTEISQSQKGVHIIIKGNIPQGRRRDKVEVYCTARYMICTGNVIQPLPIEERQELLTGLYLEMPSALTGELIQVDSNLEDEEIFELATNAANADKFNKLCGGDWQNDYESQSEADFALLSIFAFYTQDNEQVRRLFRMSALGKREKAVRNDKYLDFALEKIRAQQPPPVDTAKIDAFTESMLAQQAAKEEEKKKTEIPTKFDQPSEILYPPGLIGNIARFIHKSAVRPVPEIALGAAIALVSGVIGRSFNISGSGLNQYIIVLAKTGSGKEGGASGIDAMISAIRDQIPMADQFIGPGAFASGQALIRVLDEKQCFVSVLGEFGLTLQQLCDNRANSNQIMLRRVLLDLYSKSGWGKTLRSSVYSDTDKNTAMVQSPNVTIFGESTPETFYEGLDQSHIAEGLIPRFSILEYTGKRLPRNKNAFSQPSTELVHEFGELVNMAIASSQNNTCGPVQIAGDAITILDSFDEYADGQINCSNAEVDMQLWNRAHLKALKLGGLVAVGVNPHQPIVTKEIAEWAIAFVRRDINTVLSKFAQGDVGTGESKQESDIRKAVAAYLDMDKQTRRKYKISETLVDKQVVPYAYISRRLRQRAAFKNDRRGAKIAIEAMLEDMVKAEMLQEISKQQARSEFGANTNLYVLGSHW
jgi:hypothetical protein